MPTPFASYPVSGIVLAAGEGMRLRPLIRRLRGDYIPKQYVNFIGTRSMLEHTFARAERIIPRDRIFTVVGRDHLRYGDVRGQLSTRSAGTVVVQPANRETGPGVLLPLIYLYNRFPGSVVALFPSDHFVLEETRLMSHVSIAVRAVLREPSRLILLAIEPERPEPQYGYILPGRSGGSRTSEEIRQVAGFIEKPDVKRARWLVSNGGLWNTMIMVFNSASMLDLYKSLFPSLEAAFRPIENAIGTSAERHVLEQAYHRLAPVNFSKDLLEMVIRQTPERLSVLPIRGVRWSDWGSEERVVAIVRQLRRKSVPGSPRRPLKVDTNDLR